MPIYDYQCPNGHITEVIVKFSDPPLEECPECGEPVSRKYSPPIVDYKGPGFYTSDNKVPRYIDGKGDAYDG